MKDVISKYIHAYIVIELWINVYLTSATFYGYLKSFFNNVCTSMKIFDSLHTIDNFAFAFLHTYTLTLLAGVVVRKITWITSRSAFTVKYQKWHLFAILVFVAHCQALVGRNTSLFELNKKESIRCYNM